MKGKQGLKKTKQSGFIMFGSSTYSRFGWLLKQFLFWNRQSDGN